MAWAGRGGRRAARRAARHRWDELFPAAGPGLLDTGTHSGVDALLASDTPSRVDALGESGSPPRVEGLPDPDTCAAPDGQRPPDEVTRISHARRRLAVSLRAAAALVVVLAVSGGLWWWSSASAAPDVRSVEAADEADAGHSHGAEADETSGDETPAPGEGQDGGLGGDVVVAHVAGAVGAPGVYRLPRSARYHEAIAAAGGAAPDADVHRLNLAAAVEDGMRLYVPRVGEAMDPGASGAPAPGGGAPAAGGSAGGAPAAGAKVNLNTATVDELGALPRVGPVLAQRIVDFRAQHGRFGAPEDLDAVDGIGPKMLEALLPLVTV